MARIHRVWSALALLTLAAASTASADGTQSWDIYGGSSFTTHAAVRATVVGTRLRLEIWNPGGSLGLGDPGAVFLGIGLYNVPKGVKFKNGDAIMGANSPRRGTDTPGAWGVANSYKGKKDVELPEGIKNLDVYAFAREGEGWASHGIAGTCSTGLPAAGVDKKGNPVNHLWQSGCDAWVPAPVVIEIEFEYKKEGKDDPAEWKGQGEIVILAGTGADRYSLMVTGEEYGNVSVTPEPVSMTLLATGLLGMGGVGVIRRRRRQGQLAD